MTLLNLAVAALIAAANPPAMDVRAPDPSALIAAQCDAMKIFDWMSGEWRGQATAYGPGGAATAVHTERIGPMLDGSVRLVEGRAYNEDGSTAFNALAMLSFDATKREYRMASHAQGQFSVFKIEPTATGYVWSIPAGPTRIRYTARFANGVWSEVGERIVEGSASQRIFSMELRRVGASAWPVAGAVVVKGD